jgi:cardiolipin synthase
MFGRGRHAFSREQTVAKLLETSTLADRAAQVVAAQPGAIAALARTQGEFARLAGMLWASGRSPLTMGNGLEILQNASEKYPRLIEDIRTASRSVHLLYYEWASVEGLRRAGVQMQPFSSIYQLHTLSYRSHRKLAIVDGRVGYRRAEHDGQASDGTEGLHRLARHPHASRAKPSRSGDHFVRHTWA